MYFVKNYCNFKQQTMFKITFLLILIVLSAFSELPYTNLFLYNEKIALLHILNAHYKAQVLTKK
jgi:hypothetical protein